MKWYQGQISKRVHAFMKAEAQINDKTIPEYINELVEADLERKGYAIKKNEEASGAAARSRLPKNPGAINTEAAGVLAFFDKEIRPLDDSYINKLQSWIMEHGSALVLQVLKDAVDETENPNYPPLPFIDSVLNRLAERSVKSVEEYQAAKIEKRSVIS